MAGKAEGTLWAKKEVDGPLPGRFPEVMVASRVEVAERPVRELGAHDVLLAVSHCGVCGSDIHFVLQGWGRPGSVEGHEYSATVVAVGDEVTDWAVGDEVTVDGRRAIVVELPAASGQW